MRGVRLFVCGATVLALIGCSGKVDHAQQARDLQRARDNLKKVELTIPDSYSLVSMTYFPEPFVGQGWRSGAFESTTSPPAPMLLRGNPIRTEPVACDRIPQRTDPDWLKAGFNCDMPNGRYGVADSMYGISVFTGELPSGESRIYLRVEGH
ncbi:hypothetical protein [Mycobacteroides franklinii]|uniref:Uncharacterized protein n=1 Tax=Mycobacteroides franklinii TaxID=948102 RepID=A0A4R8R2L0_9MYCO|nr:hypothetical protein [Mycobacteroides franklinii]TDZ43236.1 hypothetical protein CCUG64054_03290 [Mycobacteroides franklinii]TDZ50371.1 hypothetical protein CCUG63697_01876 [Mycobacteroides franklinii]TDZ56791.1 hypothetical protein CCUG63696_03292 [Mycobacteroides franklinii]TDZ63732.1 hypothetical protein CCUG63695_03217 [Mycobacteroides franklinii]TDZ70129.1 hypothetical protein CCUG64056_03290 [Mycobacteroides franklinii]